jgi:ATP-dependent Clp protease ATP-binding subunit ClpX
MNSKELFCSFCGKNRREVKRLIVGPENCICDECVSLGKKLIEKVNPKTRVIPFLRPPKD